LQQVEAGQVWRLVTPIFVHFGVLHLGFNMLWLWDLGRILETRRGAILTLVFVAVAAVVTGLAQFYLEGSPLFGGMSGVIYAMLGYIWVQGVCNPWFGYVIRPQVMLVMIAWLVLCWTGLLGPIANWAHVAGLVLGVAVGWLTSGFDRPADGGSPA
jgi:membrane associated rhomboid family serine protease